MQKVFLKISQNAQENICACNFTKKEPLAQVFSGEFCEIFKNTFFIEHLWRLLLPFVTCCKPFTNSSLPNLNY